MRMGFLCLLLSLPLAVAASAQRPNPNPGGGGNGCPEFLLPGHPPPPGCPTPTTVAQSGTVYTGQYPVAGAQVYIFQANTTGYPGQSITIMSDVPGSTFLDTSSLPTANDYYAVTDAGGNFTLYYTCTPGSQVYVYSVGGDASFGPNSAIGELASLGSCTTAMSIPSISMTEVTTVAAAYAMAGFAVDTTDVSSSGTTLAQTGIANAFTNAGSLASISTGAAVTFLPSSVGFPAWQTVNSLADILAACNESSGPGSTACSTLLGTATSNPISGGTAPTDTATAAINMAHYPAYNISTLYGLIGLMASPPYTGLGFQPNDFTVNIQFGGGGGGCTCGSGPSEPTGIAIDGQGNVWITNYFFSASNTFVTELSSSGVNLSGLTGFGSGSGGGRGIAIDNSGNAWVAAGSSIVELSGGSVSSTVTSGGLDNAVNVAFDLSGNIWASNKAGSSVSEFTPFLTAIFPYGDVLSPLSGANGIAADSSGNIWVAANYNVVKLNSSGTVIASTPITSLSSGGGLNAAAIDSVGNVWVPNANTNSVTKLSSSDIIISPSGGYTAGGMSTPHSISIDGAGNVWVANTGGSITEFSNAGSLLSGTNGFEASPYADDEEIAIDPSGNAWVASLVYVSEIIGVATPVVTPLATAVATGTLGTRP